MRKYIISGAVFLAAANAAPTAAAQPPVPREQFTPQAHVWLSRAMVAEAGWRSQRDHVAIAYVLARRWTRLKDRWESMRFVDVIRNYCAGLGDYRRSLTRRQKWIRHLWPDALQPQGWPQQASWERHQPLWEDALQRSAKWSRGELRDPCKGKAVHWGGGMDSPRGRMVAIDCGDTRNTFYKLKPGKLASTQEHGPIGG